jgi:hypothetical protein
MWEPRRLTTLWAFTASYRDSFMIISKNAGIQFNWIVDLLFLTFHRYSFAVFRWSKIWFLKVFIKYIQIFIWHSEWAWGPTFLTDPSSIWPRPGPGWKWVVRITLRSLYPRKKSSQYALDRRRLDGPHSQNKNLLPVPEIGPRFPGRPARSLVTVATVLPWLHIWAR